MNEKEIIKSEHENGVQYAVRLKQFKAKQIIKIKAEKNSCIISFMALSENYLNIEMKINNQKNKDLNTRAKIYTCPASPKVYQKFFKMQEIKENESVIFEVSRKKGIDQKYNIDLAFKLYYIKPKSEDGEFEKVKNDISKR